MKTIVWDVDDVLNNLMATWLETVWRPSHPTCFVTCPQLTENPPHRLLGITVEEYLQSLDEFRLNRFKQLKPVAEILTWFEVHGCKFRHIALTATPLSTARESAAWVLQHFGRWIRTFAVVPSARATNPAPLYDQTKGDYLRWWGQADIVIDDNPTHVIAAQEQGLTGLLVSQPWNQNGWQIEQVLDFLNEGVQ